MPDPAPTTLDFGLTALPGDCYLRLPILGPACVIGALDDPLVMVDGMDPQAFPELEVLEPEEQHEGLFPIHVRTVLCLARARIAPWLAGLVPSPTPEGLARAASDEAIVGVLYWGSEDERWRLRRVCIGRYSRIEDLPDTSELDSLGAFRDWLLVQGNQFQAWTLFRDGWSDYNTTHLARLIPFLQRYCNAAEQVLSEQHPGLLVTSASLDHRKLEDELNRRTAGDRWGVQLQLRWDFATGRVTRIEDRAIKA